MHGQAVVADFSPAGRQPIGLRLLAVLAWLAWLAAPAALAQMAGSIRGMVFDKDFDAPLPAAQVSVAETGETTTGSDDGNFAFRSLAPGVYTLIFAKEGYTRQIMANIVVSEGRLTDIEAYLSGEYTEMEEFVVQDIQLSNSSEVGLLTLRLETPALLDSIGSEMMSQAGAGDAASALKLVAGATVQDGKYAVVRGLPDRYVNSQMNSVRLPTADPDKRAVQLDQFPAALIDSIQVSKTFTPDQQGDASGGAVNVVLKGIPDQLVASLKIGTKYNTQATGNEEFLTYKGGGVDRWANDTGKRDIPADDFAGAVGVTRDNPSQPYDWTLALGNQHSFGDGYRIGAFGSFFYKRESSYFEGGRDDAYWVETPGQRMTPQWGQGSPEQGDFKTSLFDVTKGSEEVQWGWLTTAGIESENHLLSLLSMGTRSAEDSATLAEDVRGKQWYFPGYQPNDLEHEGSLNADAAPYLRNETLEYVERHTDTLQWHGRHKLALIPELGLENFFVLLPPEVDWTVAHSSSSLYSPDKRQFGSQWRPAYVRPGFPQWGIPPAEIPAVHLPSKAAANFTIGNLQRIWKDVEEDSEQFFVNLKLPFRQWSGDNGYLKLGYFSDQVKRDYRQSSYSNFNDNAASYTGGWADFWSAAFPDEVHPVTAADIDVDYTGDQEITAWYYMVDLPLCPYVNIIGGARYESTELNIVNDPEKDVTWIPPGSNIETKLNAGEADVEYEQDDILPALGLVVKPLSQLTLRASYSQTVARQTFKELTPIQQMEYLGGDVFIGNPELRMSEVENFDLRLDFNPYPGGLLSVSWFRKKITDPIEYVQRLSTFVYTTAVNYPEGELEGYELEIRQELGRFWHPLAGLSVGANATFIDSEVTLPEDESAGFDEPNIQAPMATRDMMNAPEHLYNLYCTYEVPKLATKLGLFYTVQGDTLVAGAGQSKGNYVPNVYAKEYGTLNFSLSQPLGKHITLAFQAKNLLNPAIAEVYRSDYLPGDVDKTSYKRGIEYSIAITGRF